jgi:hypothetical protein
MAFPGAQNTFNGLLVHTDRIVPHYHRCIKGGPFCIGEMTTRYLQAVNLTVTGSFITYEPPYVPGNNGKDVWIPYGPIEYVPDSEPPVGLTIPVPPGSWTAQLKVVCTDHSSPANWSHYCLEWSMHNDQSLPVYVAPRDVENAKIYGDVAAAMPFSFTFDVSVMNTVNVVISGGYPCNITAYLMMLGAPWSL